MQVKVLLFAAVRDAADSELMWLDVGDDPRAADIIEAVGARLPEISSLLPSCRLAVDHCYVTADTKVAADSEIALIPPVSGG